MVQVQQLKALAEKAKHSEVKSIFKKYELLKKQLFRLDKNAKSFLLERNTKSLSQILSF